VNTWRKIVVGVGLGAYLVGLGVLSGMMMERMRFDSQRSEVIGRYQQALREWQMYRIALEKATGGTAMNAVATTRIAVASARRHLSDGALSSPRTA
jgi:hypothetical protein